VFELERRIYRIDRLRLNPGGVPVRGVVYFLALTALSMLAGAFPPTAVVAQALPWYMRALIAPGLGAALLALIRVDGRPFHIVVRAQIGFWASPRHLAGVVRRTSVGTCWLPEDIVLLPDGSDAQMRRLSYSGPGAALVTVEHERHLAPGRRGRSRSLLRSPRAALTLCQCAGGRALTPGQVVVLDRGARLLTAGRGTARDPRDRLPLPVGRDSRGD
jgi:hypothetical protein